MSDYYFNKWKKTLDNLINVIKLDLKYQETKAHDKQICEAIQKLTGTLGNYIVCYNDALDCLQHNLQIQKTEYIADVVNSIVARILELKDQLRKLEGAYFQFFSNGLIERKLAPCDAEFCNIPMKYKRPDLVKLAVEEALRTTKEKEEEIVDFTKNLKDKIPEDESLEKVKWWEDREQTNREQNKGINVTAVYEVEEKISEETLKRREIVAMIQTHEKTRQVTQTITHQGQKRELWVKELKGILIPQAPFVLRERSVRLIQKILRFYFEIKRRKIKDCKREQLLDLIFCNKINTDQREKDKMANLQHLELYKSYQDQREADSKRFKQNYLKRKRDDIVEEYRDYVRDWFRKWYFETNFFHDIKENQGGTALILKEEVISTSEWLEKYEDYLETKKANKNKTALQLKWEKKEAKKEDMVLKKEELKKKKLEADLLKKMMKNPTLHPGYHYPGSKKTEHILTVIEKYNRQWKDFDNTEYNIDAKEKYVKSINIDDVCKDFKLEVCQTIDDEMREELKILKKALKEEYERNGERMPEQFKEKIVRKKRKLKVKVKINDNMQDKLNNLATKGYLKDYPKTYFNDFVGDINYAGADLRCDLKSAVPFGGEVRAVWWERCREVIHGYKRTLLVGPKSSGKTTLVHIMATVNDAILYQLDPCEIKIENINNDYLQQLINAIAICAKRTQPSIIYIRHIERLYYRKVPPQESYRNFDLIKRFLIRKLFKKIHKTDNVTIIGSCTEPWISKSKRMLKKFQTVLLMPETNYSTVHLILRNWSLNNRIIPHNFHTQGLAYMLRGYPFGYIVRKLEDFLTAERIVNIAAYGLSPQDIYDYFLEDENEIVIGYERYLKWYTDKTHWGQLERKHLEERKEFKLVVEKWKEKMEKKKNHKIQI